MTRDYRIYKRHLKEKVEPKGQSNDIVKSKDFLKCASSVYHHPHIYLEYDSTMVLIGLYLSFPYCKIHVLVWLLLMVVKCEQSDRKVNHVPPLKHYESNNYKGIDFEGEKAYLKLNTNDDSARNLITNDLC